MKKRNSVNLEVGNMDIAIRNEIYEHAKKWVL